MLKAKQRIYFLIELLQVSINRNVPFRMSHINGLPVSKRRNFNSGNISVGCAIDRQAFALFGAQIHTRMKVIGTDFSKRSSELQGYIQGRTAGPFLPLRQSRRKAKKKCQKSIRIQIAENHTAKCI